MTPQDMAALHAAAFAPARGWSADEFETLCQAPFVTLHARTHGFALVRTVAGEAELLTLAVDPEHQRRGVANAIMRAWMQAVPATRGFLEVAADNAPAQALYRRHGFAVIGRRKGYYRRSNGAPVDAVLMQVALTHRQNAQTQP